MVRIFREGLICCYFTRIAKKACCCHGISDTLLNTIKLKIDIDSLEWNEQYCQDNVSAAAALQEGTDICGRECDTCGSCGGCS